MSKKSEDEIKSVADVIGPDSVTAEDEEKKKIFEEFKKMAHEIDPELDDLTILRFIRARKFDKKAALEQLEFAVNWRKEFRADSLVSRKLLMRNVSRVLIPEIFHGHDKWNRPAYIFKVGKMRAYEFSHRITLEQNLQSHVWGVEYQYERLRKKLNENVETKPIAFSNILDLEGMGWDARHFLPYMKSISKLDERVYPELNGCTFLINCPSLFPQMFKIVKPLLDPHTVSKIKVLSGDYKDILLQNFDKDQLPEEYGGTCKCGENGGPCLADNSTPSVEELNEKIEKEASELMELKKEIIEAGKEFTQDIEINVEPGKCAALIFFFKTDFKDIKFGVDFEGKDGTKNCTIEKRSYNSQEFCIFGDYLVYESGKYTVCWDNKSSYFSKKYLTFGVTSKEAPSN